MPVDGRLTLDEMRETIRQGGGVLLNGKPITRLEDLPAPEVHMRGDLVQLRTTLAALDKQMADLTGQRQRIVAEIEAAQGAVASAAAPSPPASDKKPAK